MDNKYIAVIIVLLFAVGFFFFKSDLWTITFAEDLADSYQTWFISAEDSYSNMGYGRHAGVPSRLNYEGTPNSTLRFGDYKVVASGWARYKYVSDRAYGCESIILTVTKSESLIKTIKVIINYPGSYALTCPYGTTTDTANDIYFVNTTNSAGTRTSHIVSISNSFALGLGVDADNMDSAMLDGGSIWYDDYGGGWTYFRIHPIYNYTDKLTFYTPTESYLVFEGENKTLDFILNNQFVKDINGQIKATLYYDTPTGTQSTTLETPKQKLSLGNNSFTLNLPTESTGTLTLKLQPIVYVQGATKILISSKDGFGAQMQTYLVSQNYTIIGLSYYDKDSAGKTTEIPVAELPIVTKEYLINPQPIWLSANLGACPEGYTYQFGSDLCIRDDILDNQLSCMQLGCPVVDEHEYSCSSAGICVETVYTQKNCTADSDCPDIAKCDVGSGLCIDEKIFNQILQCDTSSDCPNPCQGKSITCNQGNCEYDGECSITEVGCSQFGCEEGYLCNEARNTCERTITKFKLDTNMILFISAASFIGGIVIYYLVSTKKR